MRIPDDELNRWKQSADLLALMRADGMAMAKNGRDWVCTCPFHDDANPSLRMTPKTMAKPLDLWNCPACQTGGDALQWLMKFRRLSFRAAVELLREGAGASEAAPLSGSAGLPCPVSPDMDKAQMLAAVLGYYHLRLRDETAGREAREYLESRGIGDAALISHFHLGVADRTLGLRLPVKQLKDGLALRVRLIELGLLRGSGHEHLNGCAVFPICALDGSLVKAYGRVMAPDRRRNGGANHLYLPGKHAGVLNSEGYGLASAAGGPGYLVLCEAPIDALTLWASGMKNTCAAWGTGGFTDDHLAALKEAQVKEVRIAFDRDEAGDKGAQAVAEKLRLEGIAAYRVELPMGLDVNAYAMRFPDPIERAGVLKQAIRCASFIHGDGAKPRASGHACVESLPLAPVAYVRQAQAQVAPVLPVPDAAADAAAFALAAVALPAAPLAPAVREFALEHAADFSEVVAEFGAAGRERVYRVRGLQHNTGPERLKVQVKVWQKARPELMHADTLDLSQARARAIFIHEAGREIGEGEPTVKADIAKLFGELEAMRDGMNAEREKPKAQVSAADTMPQDDKAQALGLLRSPNLLARIMEDFAACGVVGEETNKLVGYLAATSRLLARPLAIVVQSSSAAGKSSLLDAVLAMMPDEAQVRYSAMTGQSLYYMGGDSLKHKILAIAEEEGAEQASYSLKLLQSEGKLAIATPSKDAQGQIKTERYEVEGPCSIFLTTTAADVDEELLNRCLVLTVDEDREQTQRIHAQQRKAHTLGGLKAQVDKARLLRLHQNAQRLLMGIRVVNPFAEQLTFLAGKTRTRRDQPKYLDLIATIALLHQHQRPVLEHACEKTGEIHAYIEATREDIQTANRLMGEVLGRSLDELPPQTRRLLGLIESMVQDGCKVRGIKRNEVVFTRREVREWAGWGNTQIKTHMLRLEEMEYVAVRKRGPLMLYELVYDCGQAQVNGGKFLPGLLDPATLQTCAYDGDRSGLEVAKSAPGRPQVGAVSGECRSEQNASFADENGAVEAEEEKGENTTHLCGNVVAGVVIDQEAQVQDQKTQAARASSLAALLAADQAQLNEKPSSADARGEAV